MIMCVRSERKEREFSNKDFYKMNTKASKMTNNQFFRSFADLKKLKSASSPSTDLSLSQSPESKSSPSAKNVTAQTLRSRFFRRASLNLNHENEGETSSRKSSAPEAIIEAEHFRPSVRTEIIVTHIFNFTFFFLIIFFLQSWTLFSMRSSNLSKMEVQEE